ncbi:MAG: ATP-binding cassette domain-containing protein, partial [Chromatiaceae bacterium]
APDPGRLRDKALGLLRQFRLEERALNKAEWLSGGEAQRTAICRALINDPRIIIADEPTANLDSQLSRELLALIGELADQGKGILISSHDPLVFDHARVSRVVELRDGRLA